MTWTLAIGDRMYSSWSMRIWLIFEQFGIPATLCTAHMTTPAFTAMMAAFAPARLVPVIRSGAQVVWDSTAITETLAETCPELWPEAPVDRALARSVVAEMHAGFGALRSACPMNLRCMFDYTADATVRADLDRLELLLSLPGQRTGGPWLFGRYTAADAFLAPVAARIAGYGLPVGPRAQSYVADHLASGPFRRWRAMAFADDLPLPRYEDNGLARAPWPGPTPLPAAAVRQGPAENIACPYSGKPVSPDSLARIDGRIVGFCNPFCRDKSVADPQAWPTLVRYLSSGPGAH